MRYGYGAGNEVFQFLSSNILKWQINYEIKAT
jgi:hypothetical protein